MGIKLGVIGFGNMARAILRGVINSGMGGFLEENALFLDVAVSDKNAPDLTEFNSLQLSKDENTNSGLKNVQLRTVLGNKEAVNGADYVLLAVKPQSLQEAVYGIDFKDSVVISIMAGIRIEKLKQLCNTNKIVRVMPNLNASVQRSVNSYSCCGLSDAENEFIVAFLNSFGCSLNMNESMINSATGIAGCGPAYVFMFIKGLIDSAIERGFSNDEALFMAISTVAGSALKVADLGAGADIDALINAVCSKGGATIEGVNHLREHGFEDIIKTAIDKSINRAEELG